MTCPRTCWDGAKGCPPLILPASGSQRLRILIKKARDSSRNVFQNLGSGKGLGDSLNSPCAFGCKHSASHSPTCLLKASISQPSWLAALGRAGPDLQDAARSSLGLPGAACAGPGPPPPPPPGPSQAACLPSWAGDTSAFGGGQINLCYLPC